jgi:hypothetical protein
MRTTIFLFLTLCFFFVAPLVPTIGAAEQQPSAPAPATVSPNPPADAPGMLDQFKELPDQVATPIKTEKIDRAGEEISVKIGEVGVKATPLLGNWINTELAWGITWFKMLSCLLLVLLVIAGE